jgi:hypothetical protein
MNCQEFREFTLDAPEAVAHLQDCPPCAAWRQRQDSLIAGLRAMSAESQHVGAPANLEAKLVAAFRAHGGTVAPIRAPRMWAPVATWLAAAAALVAVAFVLSNQRLPQPVPHRNPPAIVESAANEVDDSSFNSADFIPLPNAQQLAPNEDVNLVRVEVPRSTMIALGYDVSAERASEPVEAEVVLGPDGLARAVRFLE